MVSTDVCLLKGEGLKGLNIERDRRYTTALELPKLVPINVCSYDYLKI